MLVDVMHFRELVIHHDQVPCGTEFSFDPRASKISFLHFVVSSRIRWLK